jgi:LSD1 subclass zinc finger protein
MKKKLLELLVCPKCNASLEYDRKAEEMLCAACQLAYPVRDDIPVLIEADARSLK